MSILILEILQLIMLIAIAIMLWGIGDKLYK
jgi:hypothetical protein